MRLLIIRHGESEADLLNVHEGRADFALTPKGHAQAEAMGNWVSKNYTVTKLYHSPLLRAKQTAEHLIAHCDSGLNVTEDALLMEFNNGLLAGMERDKAAKQYPEIIGLPLHQSVYEQESKLEFRFRADYMLSKLLSENNPDDTIAVITHGGMIMQLYHSFLGLPAGNGLVVATGDTGIHEWLVKDNKRIVLYANRTSHLIEA